MRLSGAHFAEVKLNHVPGLSSSLAIDRKHHTLFALAGTSSIREMLRFDPRSSSFTSFLPGADTSEIDYSHDGQWLTYMRIADQSLWVSRAAVSALPSPQIEPQNRIILTVRSCSAKPEPEAGDHAGLRACAWFL